MNRLTLKNLIILSCLLILSGCSIFGDDKENEPTTVTLSISAAKTLNPDIENRSSPVVLRVYQLTHIDTFNNSDFFALYENDQTLLAKELTFYQEIELKPEQSKTQVLEIPKETQFIAAVAAFRDLDKSQWKASLPLNALTPLPIKIQVNALSVEILAEKQAEED